MKYLILLILLLVPSRGEAQGIITADGWPTHIAVGSYIVLQGIDLATTEYGLGTRKVIEGNPILAPFSSNPVKYGAFKMITAVGTSYLLLHYHTNHPKLAFWTAVAADVIYTGVVVHNSRAIK